MRIPLWAGVDIEEHGVPFGSAQGRLSTSFGWRLTSLRMTEWNRTQRLIERTRLER
jgi:hypothetical protein